MTKGISNKLTGKIQPPDPLDPRSENESPKILLFAPPIAKAEADTALSYIAGKFIARQVSASRLAVVKKADDDKSGAPLTVTDFLHEIQSRQPFDETALAKRKVSVELKLSKPPQQLSVADYEAATWQAIFNRAGYTMLSGKEIGMAVQAIKNTGYQSVDKGFTLSNLRRFDALPGPMFVKTDQAMIEKAKRAGQAVLQYQEYQAKQSDVNRQRAQSETNQMFADQGRVLWNAGVNIVEGTINQGIDAALSKGGQDAIYNNLPEQAKPHVDFSAVKPDYQSEMMRRDMNGKVDGDGIKMGQAVEIGVTIAAPFVVGAAVAAEVAPPSLKSRGGLPEVESSISVDLFSPQKLEGIEKASLELLKSVESKGRTVVIAKEGSEELRFLNYFNAEANAGGVGNTHIILRENPSKAALLEEFLHGTQNRLGIIGKLGDVGAEVHVKDFMIRHRKMLNFADDDVNILRQLKTLEEKRIK